MQNPTKKIKKRRKNKWANRLCGLLLLAILVGIGAGFYFRLNGQTSLGDKYIGISVLGFAFVLMPIFLVVRWRGKRLKDYTLTKENLDRMRDKGID